MDLIRFDDLRRETANRLKTCMKKLFRQRKKSHLSSCENGAGRENGNFVFDGKEELIGLNINMLAGDLAILDYYAILPKNAAADTEVLESEKSWNDFRTGN